MDERLVGQYEHLGIGHRGYGHHGLGHHGLLLGLGTWVADTNEGV
jgi:hypothetical protein